jgi:hypothetical protein
MKPLSLQSLVALVGLASMFGCSSGTGSSGWVEDNSALTSPGPLMNAAKPLITPTYDGSGEVVEPTVLYFPNGWNGHAYWMVVSPYPNIAGQEGKEPYENPAILVSEDGQKWDVPAGLKNPIALPEQGTLADATGVFDDKSDQLFVYFLNDVKGAVYHESLLRTTSTDGIHWTKPQILISGDNTFVNSASVTKVGDTFYLWAVDTGIGCGTLTSTVNVRTSLDGAAWSNPIALNFTQPGFVIWHLNTIAVPSKGQFMSLLAAYPVGTNCDRTRVFFANSHDGLNWQTYPHASLSPGKGWDSLEIYRSSLLYDPDTKLLRVWYSARDDVKLQWHVGYTAESFSVQ